MRLIFVLLFFFSFEAWSQDALNCKINEESVDNLANKIAGKDGIKIFQELPRCLKANRELVLKVSLNDPLKFQYADKSLHDDEIFINRILKVHPDILQFISYELRDNKRFMELATYIQRDSLQYASLKLRDSKSFMTKMIEIDSRNYFFASYRLQNDPKIAKIAFSDNGLLLEAAPDKMKANYNLVEIAVKSNSKALQFASPKLQSNQKLQELTEKLTSIGSQEKLKEYIKENYVAVDKHDKNVFTIVNQGKFFAKNMLVDRDYIAKWQFRRKSKFNKAYDKISMMTVENRNLPQSWREDFENHPLLLEKVDNFFKKHYIDDDTIDNMKTTYFWVIKDDLPTVAFNIYGLRSNRDEALGPEFVDISSLTVITQKQDDRWNLTVIEVIFSSDVKLDMAYNNGHKRYILWDLYKRSEFDLSPKVIFKVEDRFEDYFEVYEEQSGGKYEKIATFKF